MNDYTHASAEVSHRAIPRLFDARTSPSSPKSSGHDTVLRAIQNKGAMITVTFLSGEVMTGKLVARDKYTLTVRTASGTRNVVFKHSMERFSGEESSADIKDI